MKKAAYLVLTLSILAIIGTGFKINKPNYLPTSLRITVIDGLGNYVDSATVTIYGNEEDFKNSENPVQESQYTDKKGRVTFKDIEPQAYYVDVIKGKLTNYGAAQLTPELKEGRINKVNIVID